MALIHDDVNEHLNNIVGKCFEINRMLDRGMSLLKVRWKLIRMSDILHEKVAHAYPSSLFADGVSDYQGSRDNETIYPATPIGDKEYATVLDFFLDYHRENLELEYMINDAIDEAVEKGDITTKVFLDSILKNLVSFTALSQDMMDLVEKCDNNRMNLQLLDSMIEDYIKL